MFKWMDVETCSFFYQIVHPYQNNQSLLHLNTMSIVLYTFIIITETTIALFLLKLLVLERSCGKTAVWREKTHRYLAWQKAEWIISPSTSSLPFVVGPEMRTTDQNERISLKRISDHCHHGINWFSAWVDELLLRFFSLSIYQSFRSNSEESILLRSR